MKKKKELVRTLNIPNSKRKIIEPVVQINTVRHLFIIFTVLIFLNPQRKVLKKLFIIITNIY